MALEGRDTFLTAGGTLEWTSTQPVQEADFYPYLSTNVTVQTVTEQLTGETGKIRLRKRVEKLEGAWPSTVAGLLIEKGENEALLAAI